MTYEQIAAAVVGEVRANISADTAFAAEVGTTLLVDLGIDSMRLITIIMDLEEQIGLDLERLEMATPPETVDDLVRLAVLSCVAGPLDGSPEEHREIA